MNALAWVFLIVAIAAEVVGTLSLRMAASGPRVWYVPVVAGYATTFVTLSLALAQGMPLGVAYGVWVAIGVAAVALLSRVLFGERFTWLMAIGVALVIGGVLLVETGAHR